MGDRFIRMPEVEHRVGLKKTAIYQMIKNGSFPAPRKLAVNCSVWIESSIDGWIAQKIEETDPARYS
jgi:prophage regulatory protein